MPRQPTIPKPTKPFATYKWRWASVTPTEGLNEAPVFLGVLRALRTCEGETPSSIRVFRALREVERDNAGRVGTRAELARSTKRNLLRNSQQYWKALGLLERTRGGIALTEFGRNVADGVITRAEFVHVTIKSLALPNGRIESAAEIAKWAAAGMSVRPLDLVLRVLVALDGKAGSSSAFLSHEELVRVTIPLAGVGASVATHVNALLALRSGALAVVDWPDCAPAANDQRMAREFLIFLANNGLCTLVGDVLRIRKEAEKEVRALLALSAGDADALVGAVRGSRSLQAAERERVLIEVLGRPQQARFRAAVLRKAGFRCLLSGETMPEVLEAAHLVPVKHNGSDHVSNGICLRSDIHTLMDCGQLRLRSTGEVVISDRASASPTYAVLPSKIAIPAWMNTEAIDWRARYT